MLLRGKINRSALISKIFRSHTVVKNFDVHSMDLEEHINRYKTRREPESFMNIDSLPELGNTFHNLNYRSEINTLWTEMDSYILDFMGPEQVSPHYENFGMSRRVAITFWAVSLGVCMIEHSGDFTAAIYSAYMPFVHIIACLYIYLEGRKCLILPLLNRFYGHVVNNEISFVLSNFGENMHSNFRAREAIAREQLEYFDLHKEFKHIKKEALERFFIAEQSLLKQHINNRANTILEGAQQMESLNKKAITGKVLTNIKTEFGKLKANPGKSIVDNSFLTALEGIRQGKMDYKNDGVIQKILETTKLEINKINNLTEEDKNQLLCLTDMQIKTLKDADETAQKDFLNKKPAGLDGVLRENETYAKIMAGW